MSERKSYALSKAKVREMIIEAFGKDENKTVKLGDVLALFASNRGGVTSGKDVVVNGKVVARRCSILGAYLPISEFGTTGKNEDGTPKYNYASRIGLKLKKERDAEIKKLEEELVNTEDMNKIKVLQSKIKELRNKAFECPKDVKCAKTAEEAAKLFGQAK